MKKWPKSWKIEPVYPTTTFHKIYIDISLCMGYPAGELLVLGWELRFQALCLSSTAFGAFKGPKILYQHNFEMIHFKCTIPAIQCTIPVLLCYVGLDGKKKQYATCALDSTSPKEGEGGYMLAVSPFATFLKVYFGPINFLLL